MDTFAKFAPWLVMGLMVYVVSRVVTLSHPTSYSDVALPALIIPILLFGLVIVMYVYRTKAVIIDDNGIVIDRIAKRVTINYSDIHSVKTVPDMRFAIRTFGNGGVFGYTGYFYKKGIGSMRWYCTQRRNYILIEKTNNKKIVVTPDDPDGFISDIQAIHPELVIGV
jgi:hypothetical protein